MVFLKRQLNHDLSKNTGPKILRDFLKVQTKY